MTSTRTWTGLAAYLIPAAILWAGLLLRDNRLRVLVPFVRRQA